MCHADIVTQAPTLNDSRLREKLVFFESSHDKWVVPADRVTVRNLYPESEHMMAPDKVKLLFCRLCHTRAPLASRRRDAVHSQTDTIAYFLQILHAFMLNDEGRVAEMTWNWIAEVDPVLQFSQYEDSTTEPVRPRRGYGTL